MAKYQVTDPSGVRFEVEGPDGASDDQVLAQVRAFSAPPTGKVTVAPTVTEPEIQSISDPTDRAQALGAFRAQHPRAPAPLGNLTPMSDVVQGAVPAPAAPAEAPPVAHKPVDITRLGAPSDPLLSVSMRRIEPADAIGPAHMTTTRKGQSVVVGEKRKLTGADLPADWRKQVAEYEFAPDEQQKPAWYDTAKAFDADGGLPRDIARAAAGGAAQSLRDLASAGDAVNKSRSPTQQPKSEFADFGWGDLLHPDIAIPKAVYQVAHGAPVLAAGIAGGVAGSAAASATAGPEAAPVGAIAGGSLGAGAMSVAQSLGPLYAAELQKTPKDPDGAYSRAVKQASVSGLFSAVGWAAFAFHPFEGAVKNLLFQAFGVQPGVSATQRATTNIMQGKPATEGIVDEYPSSVVSTLLPYIGMAAVHAGTGGARAAQQRGPRGGQWMPPEQAPLGSRVGAQPPAESEPIDVTPTAPRALPAPVDGQPPARPALPAPVVEPEAPTAAPQPRLAAPADAAPAEATPAPVAASPSPEPPAPAVDANPVVEAEAKGAKPSDVISKVFTPSGMKIETVWAVVDANHVELSHDLMGRPNPNFPQGLQKRDLGRAAAMQWVLEKSQQLIPEKLGESPNAGDGAPIVSPELQGETGRKRTLAIQAAYQGGHADAYRQFVEAQAQKYGIDVTGIQNPMLIRVRTTPLTDEERVKFSTEADVPEVTGMSPLEQAKADAEKITPAMMALFNPSEGGSMISNANRHFYQRFVGDVVGAGQQGSYTTKEGTPTKQLHDRIQAAVFQKAYNTDALTQLVVEEADSDIKNVLTAFNIAAKEFARVHEWGELDIRPQLMDAALLVKQIKATGKNVATYLKTADMMGRDPLTSHFAEYIAQNIKSSKRLGDALSEMARIIDREVLHDKAGDMWGGGKMTIPDVLRAIDKYIEEQHGKQDAADLFGAAEGAESGPDQGAQGVRLSHQQSAVRAAPADGGNAAREQGRVERTKAADAIDRPAVGRENLPRKAVNDEGKKEPAPEPKAVERAPVEARSDSAAVQPHADESPEQRLKLARREIDHTPTEAQKQAGNYAVGHLKLHGLDISLENAKGSVRTGVDANGKRWKSKLAWDYGYLKRTEGNDGDHVDVFIGPNLASERVFVVDQNKGNGHFDEHKVMMGFDSEAAARQGYLDNYEAGWENRIRSITPMRMDEFKTWLEHGDQTKPAADDAKLVPPQATEPPPPAKVSGDELRAWLAPLERDVNRSVDVAGTYADLPAHLREKIEAKMDPERAHKAVVALYDTRTDRVWLVANNVRDPAHAERLILHEVVAHHGLRQFLGDEFGGVMRTVFDARQKEIRASAKDGILAPYAFDLKTERGREEAAEEFIAHQSERGLDQTLVQRVIATIRRALRALGFGKYMDFSDGDILDLLRRSRDYLRGHALGDTAITTDVRMSLGDLFGRRKPDETQSKPAPTSDVAPADVRAKPGADFARLNRLLGAKLYGNPSDIASVSVKEMMQNAFDAIKGAMERGGLKKGTIDISVNPDLRAITVRDNGTGMSPQVLANQFLQIAATSKESSRASGGLGIAKGLFLYGNEHLHVETVRDGVKSTLTTTGDILMAAATDPSLAPTVKTSAAPAGEHGTRVTVKVPKEYVDPSTGVTTSIYIPRGQEHYPVLDRSPLFDDIELTFNGSHVPRSGMEYVKKDLTKFAGIKFNWGDANIYISKGERPRMAGGNVHVLSNGLWQFSQTLNKDPFDWASDQLPREIYVDLSPRVSPDDAGYPFNLNRQQLTSGANEDLKAVLNYISMSHAKESTATHNANFGAVQYVDPSGKFTTPVSLAPKVNKQLRDQFLSVGDKDTVEVRDGKLIVNGRQTPELTRDSLKAIKMDASDFRIPQSDVPSDQVIVHDNLLISGNDLFPKTITEAGHDKFGPRFGVFLHDIGTLFMDARSWVVANIPGYETMADTGIGISFDKTYRGVHTYLPFEAMAVNPAATISDVPAIAAEGMWLTMLHEMTHYTVKSHDASFAGALQLIAAHMQAADAAQPMQERLRAIMKKHADIHSFLRGALNDPASRPRGSSLPDADKQARSDGGAADLVRTGQGAGGERGVLGGGEGRTHSAEELPGSQDVSGRRDRSAQQTDSPSFKKWFGDSKVSDANGKPLTVYHGTAADFDQFKVPAFFTPDSEATSFYSENGAEIERFDPYAIAKGARTIPAYLSIKNPLDVTTKDGAMELIAVARRAGAKIDVTEDKWGGWDFTTDEISNHSDYEGSNLNDLIYSPRVREQMAKDGYDGLKAFDVLHQSEIPIWVPLRPDQIKSAIGNQGTFDASHQDILFSLQDDAREAYGISNGKVVGYAKKIGGAWEVYLSKTDKLEGSGAQRMQAASINEVQSIFAKHGMEFKVFRPSARKSEQGELADPFDIPEHTIRDQLTQKFQDKLQRLHVLERSLRSQGRNIAETEDAYLKEELFHGVSGGKFEDFQRDYTEPLVDAITELKAAMPATLRADMLDKRASDTPLIGRWLPKHDFTELKAAGLYLYAKHAPERNAKMAEINPDRPEMTSGMSNEEAAAILKHFSDAGLTPHMEKIAGIVKAMNKYRMDALVEGGLMSQETRRIIEGAYSDYVPLRGNGEVDESRMPIGRGYDMRGKELKRALGRSSQADPSLIVPYVVAQAQTAIVRAEKNQVGQTFMRLVQQNPAPDFWEINKVDIAPHFDRTTGEVVYGPDPFAKLEDNVFGVKVDGVQHYITLADEPLARGMKNYAATAPTWVRVLGRTTQYIAMINTAADPSFVVSNFLRDVQEAGLNLSSDSKKAIAASMAKNLPAAIRGAWLGIREHGPLPDGAPEFQKWYREYVEAGGKIHFLDMRDIDARAKQLTAMIRDASPSTMRKIMATYPKAVIDLFFDMNGAVENGTRLAAYAALRESGLSKMQAASYARNLTVNFNRKGELGAAVNAVYAFFNASIQGAATGVRFIFSKNGLKIAGALALLGVANDMINRLIGGKDKDGKYFWDKVPTYERERNMVFMNPRVPGDRFKVPMPYSWGPAYVIGQETSAVANGMHTPGEAVAQIFRSIMGATNPLGSNQISQMLAPSMVDPFLQHAMNEDFAGRPIKPDQKGFGPPTPESQMYWPRTPAAYQNFAQWLNRETGGNDVRSGVMDMSPNVMQHYLRSFTGGAGTFYSQLVTGAYQYATTGETPPAREIPFVRRLYSQDVGTELHKEYYDRVRDIQTAILEQKHYTEKRDKATVTEARRDHAVELSMEPIMTTFQTEMSGLRKNAATIKSANIPAELKKQRVKQIEDRQNALMARFVKEYDSRVTAHQQ